MTKNKSRLIVLLVVGVLFCSGLNAQSIQFNYTDGTNHSYNLEDVRKITFDNDVMNLHLWDGSVYSWNVNTIGYYQYNETSLNIEDVLSNANAFKVNVFPNPTNNFLNINYSLTQEDDISIVVYDMTGKMLFEKKIGIQSTGDYQVSFDLLNEPIGTFICQIIGIKGRIVKKIIKQ